MKERKDRGPSANRLPRASCSCSVPYLGVLLPERSDRRMCSSRKVLVGSHGTSGHRLPTFMGKRSHLDHNVWIGYDKSIFIPFLFTKCILFLFLNLGMAFFLPHTFLHSFQLQSYFKMCTCIFIRAQKTFTNSATLQKVGQYGSKTNSQVFSELCGNLTE